LQFVFEHQLVQDQLQLVLKHKLQKE